MTRKLLSIATLPIAASPLFAGPQFSPPVPTSGDRFDNATLGFIPRSFHPADLDGDGDQDLMLLGQVFDAQLAVFMNDGEGSFTRRQVVAPTSYVTEPVIGDFNDDGIDDFVFELTDFNAQDGVHVVFGAPGTAPLQSQQLSTISSIFYPGVRVIALDFDGDGDMDLIHGADGFGSRVFRNDRLGLPTLVGTLSYSFGNAAAVDFDDDGFEDLISTDGSLPGVAWSRSLGNGLFAPPVTLATFPGGFWRLRAGDVNGDGTEDLIADRRNFDTRVLLNLAGGTFLETSGTALTGSTTRVRGTLDLDLDGDLDLLAQIGVFLGVHRGDGAGSFTGMDELGTTSTFETDILAIDMDGDLDLDLVLPDSTWRRNDRELQVDVCAAAPNSSGLPAHLCATGSQTIPVNLVQLKVDQLPARVFGAFLTSTGTITPIQPMGSSGDLCIGAGGTFQFFGTQGAAQFSATSRSLTIDIDLTRFPGPGGSEIAITSAGVRYFQAWYRDRAPSGAATSNFSNAVSIDFII